MKSLFLFLFFFYCFTTAHAQSPFDFGQNKKTYFVSASQREKWNLDSIYTIEQYPENQNGGMGENWDITLISFDTSEITDNWYPTTFENNFVFNFDSIKAHMAFLNGTTYQLSNNKLVAYGGGGYGTFDWSEVLKSTKDYSIVMTSCVGHCGGQAHVKFAKNVFNQKNQLIYSVRYPTPDEGEDWPDENLPLDPYESFLTKWVSDENPPDSTFYQYNKKGQLLEPEQPFSSKKSKAQLKQFSDPSSSTSRPYYQCYVGDLKMEEFIQDKIGYTPALLLVEIYQYGVFSFTLNPSDQKYYRSASFILEE